jgi:hypothetical protein
MKGNLLFWSWLFRLVVLCILCILRVEQFYEKHTLTNVWNFFVIEITVNESEVLVVIRRTDHRHFIFYGVWQCKAISDFAEQNSTSAENRKLKPICCL